MKNTDIAIIGMSCFFPGATNLQEFWNNLIAGIDSITEVPKEKMDSLYSDTINHLVSYKGGFTPPITINYEKLNLSKAEIENIDITNLLTLKLVLEALEDASISKGNLNNSSIIIGKENYISTTDINAVDTFHTGEQIAQVVKNILPHLTESDVQKIEEEYIKNRNGERKKSDNIASFIANKLNINGTAYSLDSSSSSSLLAIENAVKELINNDIEIAIAGGVNFSQNSTNWGLYTETNFLSHKQKIQSFSKNADGFLLGEGAGFVVLKKLNQAIADNNKIYATINGISSNSNLNIIEGQKIAIQKAWKAAKVKAKDIHYIEANGSAIKTEDQAEITIFSELFKNDNLLIGSVKPNIGHTLSASGIASLIKTALSLYNQEIPATLHSKKTNEELKETSISIVSKTIKQNKENKLLFAGINSFGLNGMNIHAVLKAHDMNTNKNSDLSTIKFDEKVIAISANTKDELLQFLEQRNFSISNTTGDYRLVLFNPTKERIEKAKKLISKDKSWKGRQDIWFSNKPLLRQEGKIVFLFPGFDPSSNPELESIAQYFRYENTYKENLSKNNHLLNHSFEQSYACEVTDKALKELGVIPDMNAGHSLGEWFAANAGGLFTGDSTTELLKSMDPEKYKIDGVYFIAVGTGTEKIDPVLEKIPDLYLSNDNCPNQVLLCGTEKAKDQLIKYLKSEQIFYQILTFQSGFHSPFLKNKLYLLDEALKHIKLQKNKIPVWSATSLELYPHTKKEFKKLTIQHLTEAVRFRELIEKLYTQEQAKVFIQVGGGSLIGFVDDILKQKEYSAISSSVPRKSSLEQLRRILALLFIEGKSINNTFLGLNDLQKAPEEITLQENSSIVRSFPLLQNITKNYIIEGEIKNSSKIDDFLINSDHPVVQAMNENTIELLHMQKEFSDIIQKRKENHPPYKKEIQQNKPLETTRVRVPQLNTESKIGTSFEENLYVDIKEHPYLIDHSLFKQPEYWEDLEDIGPVIPMTMSFELLMEAANKQDPNKKILQLGPVSVFQWMKVAEPFQQIIEGTWKTETKVSLKIKNFANAEVTLGDSFPTPESYYLQNFDLGENIVSLPTPEVIYKNHMFHGPGYQGIQQITNITKKGLRAIIKKSTGKGSLLDNIGQLFGLYLQLTLGEESNVSFPVKIEEMNFYQDVSDQKGIFECICLPSSITDKLATTDIIIKRDNKVWCIIKGWKNQIFEGFDKKLWDMTMNPSGNILSKNIDKNNIYYFHNAYNKAVNWDFLMRIYLNKEEKEHYNSLMLNKKKDFLISRISLKDNVRKYISNKFNKNYFPIEIFIKYDPNKKPYIHGVPETKGIEISIAHKGSNSVSIVSDKPVGVDIETIETREQGFLDISFTKKELDLIKDKELAEWSTRLWVAKEAYGKMLGLGLQGNPKQYEIEEIQGENLIINNTIIKTIVYNNFIIGWTQ